MATSTMLGTHETARIFVWAHAVFGYSIVTLAIVLALREAFRSSGRRRLQSVALFATGFPPALLFLLSDLNLTSLNLVPIGGLLQVFALVWVLFYADFLDVVPVARYRAIEHMSDPVVTIDAQGTVLDSNPAARALASAGADWEGTPIETFFHRFPNQATNLTAVESVAVTTSDDTQRHFDVTSTPIYAPDGTIEAHQIVLRDISERVRRSQELKQSRQRYQSLFENCPIVLWEHDLSAVIERAESLADTCDDLTTYLAEHPAEHDRLLELVDVREVNQHALDAYGASSKAELVEQYPALQTDDSRATNRQPSVFS